MESLASYFGASTSNSNGVISQDEEKDGIAEIRAGRTEKWRLLKEWIRANPTSWILVLTVTGTGR